MLLLCISDIHGHLDALRAVLATAERRSFHKLLVAGDIVFPGPEPLETWRRLSAAGAVMTQGLGDRAVATLDPQALHPQSDHERERLDRMRATRDALGDLILQRIRRLPTHARVPLEDGGELVLVHGSPADPAEALTHDMSDEEIHALIGDDPADVIVCGASHVPFDRMVSEVRVVNVGSIGEAPGTGARIAHATWIESTPRGLNVEPILVPLDRPEPERTRVRRVSEASPQLRRAGKWIPHRRICHDPLREQTRSRKGAWRSARRRPPRAPPPFVRFARARALRAGRRGERGQRPRGGHGARLVRVHERDPGDRRS